MVFLAVGEETEGVVHKHNSGVAEIGDGLTRVQRDVSGEGAEQVLENHRGIVLGLAHVEPHVLDATPRRGALGPGVVGFVAVAGAQQGVVRGGWVQHGAGVVVAVVGVLVQPEVERERVGGVPRNDLAVRVGVLDHDDVLVVAVQAGQPEEALLVGEDLHVLGVEDGLLSVRVSCGHIDDAIFTSCNESSSSPLRKGFFSPSQIASHNGLCYDHYLIAVIRGSPGENH